MKRLVAISCLTALAACTTASNVGVTAAQTAYKALVEICPVVMTMDEITNPTAENIVLPE